MTTTSPTAVRDRLRSRGLDAEWRGAPPARLSGLAVDSREVVSGGLFCAISGTRADGHDYVTDAAAAGAAAAVVERPLDEVSLPQLVVSDSREAAAHLASQFAGDPASGLRLVGVTGTNGKTTTAWLARHLLGAGRSAASVGTLGVVAPDGSRRERELTTPGPLELMGVLSDLRAAGAEWVVLEVSSHALDQRRVAALRFEGAVFTTLSREHLEYHPDMEHYRRAKLRLADRVDPEGACAIRAGEEAWERADFGGRTVVRYGVDPDADVRGEDLDFGRRETRFRLRTPEGSAAVRLPLVGEYNVENALAAAAVALRAGETLDRVASRLEHTPQVPGRLEVIREEDPTVLRDYAHTPGAMERAIEAVRRSADGGVIAVFGAGGDRDPGKRPLMGAAASRLADWSVVTSDNPRSEDPAGIAEDVVSGMEGDAYEVVLDRREAIGAALERAGERDVVLLLGKGHETHIEVEGRRIPFDEAEVVTELTGGGRPAGRGTT